MFLVVTLGINVSKNFSHHSIGGTHSHHSGSDHDHLHYPVDVFGYHHLHSDTHNHLPHVDHRPSGLFVIPINQDFGNESISFLHYPKSPGLHHSHTHITVFQSSSSQDNKYDCRNNSISTSVHKIRSTKYENTPYVFTLFPNFVQPRAPPTNSTPA